MIFVKYIRKLRIRILAQSEFFRAASLLVGGTAFAQGITLLALPLVTRLYSPADFGSLAVFVSILSSITVVSCMRLEVAIPIPERESEAIDLLIISIISCSLAALVVVIIISNFKNHLLIFSNQKALGDQIWWLPVGVVVIGYYSALQFWIIRKKRYSVIASTRLKQALGGVASQLCFGWAGFGVLGLILGYLISNGAGFLSFFKSLITIDRAPFAVFRAKRLVKTFRKYISYPKYSALEVFSNNGGMQLPLIVISAAVGGVELGLFALAVRALAAPVGLIGGAVSQVYLSRAPEALRLKNLSELSLNTISGLMKIGVGPIAFIGMTGHLIFPMLFGENWQRAGLLISWMAPWFIVQLFSNSFSTALYILEKQKISLYIAIFGLVVRCSAVGFFAVYANQFIIHAYIFSSVIFYGVHLLVTLKLIGITFSDFTRVFIKNLVHIISWCLTGALIHTLGSL